MISVIIPIYNEEDIIPTYNETLFPYFEKHKIHNRIAEFIFIDDGSTDNSYKLLQQYNKFNVKILRHKYNFGLGVAIRNGIKAASGDLILTMDADLTYRPDDAMILITHQHTFNYDCVTSSPYKKPGMITSTPLRMILSKTHNYFYSLLLGKDITCVSSLFRLYKSDCIKNITIESENYEVQAEILYKLLLSGKYVKELAVPLHNREYGVSKLNIQKEMWNSIKMLYKIFKIKYL
jgi:dolichol-phosphate mannosyltransferase